MKRWLAYLLLALFSFQALPVRVLCKSIAKKATVTQPADDSEDEGLSKEKEGDTKAKAETGQEYLAADHPFSYARRSFAARVINCLHHHSRLPAAHHFEVPTPPPNPFA